MDIEKLTTTEVATLIQRIKEFLEHPVFSTPRFGKYKIEESVEDKIGGIEYKFHVYRGNLDSKYSMHIRFSQTNTNLVRLCINGSNHNNSNGTKVGKNHLHVYRYVNGVCEDYAYDLNKKHFDPADELAESMEKFFDYVHIRKK